MQVKSVDFLLTFKCPSKCRHCCYRGSPDRQGFINLKEAEGYLTELVDTQAIQSLTVHGGEPFLYFDILKGIFKKAKKLGIKERWVITNGYWAESKETAEKILTELKEAGLLCITFSVDAFHQEYIPLDNIKTGIKTALEIGFDKVVVDSYFLESENKKSKFNDNTMNLIRDLVKLFSVQFSRFPLDFEGRACDSLLKYVDVLGNIPNRKCRFPFWLGGDIKRPKGIEIDWEGNITLCPGISIGNVKDRSISEVLNRYNYQNHPILNIIAEQGPIGLYRLALEKGFKQNKHFVDECHLCYEMRRFLQPHYPVCLTPVSCYKE